MADDFQKAILEGVHQELLETGIKAEAHIGDGNNFLNLPCKCHVVITYVALYVINRSDRHDFLKKSDRVLFQCELEHPHSVERLIEYVVHHVKIENEITDAFKRLLGLNEELYGPSVQSGVDATLSR